MTTERWREIERVFDAVGACPADERAARLERECAGDPDLRREVESLLAHDAEDESFAAAAVEAAAVSLAGETCSDMAGRRIGPYRITRIMGRGGMGTVYEAVRDDRQYEQRVAVKLVRRGMGTPEDIRRFRRERQLLARLEHPNIARLLDGGSSDDGMPYIVMEYVEGLPIAEYCRGKALSTEQKLRLFVQVANAVQYAHQRLIVHRDIKPGNVLVTADGVPKLLDFGIARLAEPESPGEETAETYTAAWLLTPAYASPEQLRGQPVTAASDVYSLGALLYELLAGASPYRIGQGRAAEIERAVCEAEPVPPSQAAGLRELRGDLDNIVLMALRKEPDRRYTSAGQFAEDIRRYLEGRPVLARKDTWAYRTSKFLRRNRLALATAALVAASLLAGIVASVHQARRAERRFEEVRKLAHLMLFDLNDRLRNIPAALGARALLVDTATRYYDSLARDAGSDEALQWELAQSYTRLASVQAGELAAERGGGLEPGLGRTADARRSLEKARVIEERLAARYPAKIEYRRPLPMLYYNVGLLQNDPRKTIEYMQQGLQLVDNLGEPPDRLRGPRSMLLAGLGLAQLKAGDPKAALATFRTPPRRPESEGGEPFAFAWMGDLETAMRLFRAAIAGCEVELAKLPDGLTRRIVGKGLAVELAGAANVLGNPIRMNLGRRDEALQMARRALDLYQSVARRDARDASFAADQARAQRTMAAILQDSEPAEALEFCRKAAAVDPGARAQMVHPLRKMGRLSEALATLQAVPLESLPDEDAILAGNESGDLQLELGHPEAASAQYRRAALLGEKAVRDKPYMMLLRARLADSYERLGRLHRSAEWYEKSLAIWRDWPNGGVSSSYDQRRRREVESLLFKLRSTIP